MTSLLFDPRILIAYIPLDYSHAKLLEFVPIVLPPSAGKASLQSVIAGVGFSFALFLSFWIQFGS